MSVSGNVFLVGLHHNYIISTLNLQSDVHVHKIVAIGMLAPIIMKYREENLDSVRNET